MMDDFGAPTL